MLTGSMVPRDDLGRLIRASDSLLDERPRRIINVPQFFDRPHDRMLRRQARQPGRDDRLDESRRARASTIDGMRRPIITDGLPRAGCPLTSAVGHLLLPPAGSQPRKHSLYGVAHNVAGVAGGTHAQLPDQALPHRGVRSGKERAPQCRRVIEREVCAVPGRSPELSVGGAAANRTARCRAPRLIGVVVLASGSSSLRTSATRRSVPALIRGSCVGAR